jgi:raffinose synthase
MNEIVSGLSPQFFSSAVSKAGLDGQWITFSKEALESGDGIAFRLAGAGRWMALERYLPWWPRPVFGQGGAAPEGEFLLVLWERNQGGYGVALPVIDGNLRGILRGGSDGWAIRHPEIDPVPEEAALLFIATGLDPLALVQWAVEQIAERLGTFRLRTQKPVPQWVNYLGWCTWDAFYMEVTAEKVIEGLASFKRGGFCPRLVILDGGWQDEKENQLWSFGANPERFPQGLKPVVDRARADYGVKVFGAWHTLQGYWDGVHPQGDLAGKYQLVHTENKAGNMPDPTPRKRCLVHPDDVGRFFGDYHGYLQSQGVSMVKVDNQGSLDHFSTREAPPTATMRAYQYALQESELAHFQGESLHCMSNTTDAAYHLKAANVWRSSQDFFPAEPKTYGLHILDNALNSLWVRAFALPDWDMFQSAHPAGPFHAAARAISGGPIYVSDKPDSHDFGLLAKLALSDGQILRSSQPALPARDSLFEDGRILPRITKIVNFNKVEGCALPIGVLGLFNCFYSETGTQAAVAGEYCAADVPCIPAARFALFHHTSGRVTIAESADRFPLRLEKLGYELITVSPMENGVALFGLIDKFNGSRALESARWITSTDLELVLMDGGRAGWCSEKGVPGAHFKNASVEVSTKGSLSWVQLPVGAPVTLLLHFE